MCPWTGCHWTVLCFIIFQIIFIFFLRHPKRSFFLADVEPLPVDSQGRPWCLGSYCAFVPLQTHLLRVSLRWASHAADLWHIFTKLCKYMLNFRPFWDLKTERNELILTLPESIPSTQSTRPPVCQTSQTDANLTHLVYFVCHFGVRWAFRTLKYFKSSMCKY